MPGITGDIADRIYHLGAVFLLMFMGILLLTARSRRTYYPQAVRAARVA